MAQKRARGYFDYSLLFIIIFLVSFGLVMLYSTMSYEAQMSNKTTTQTLKNHIIGIVMGLFAMYIASIVPMKLWKALAWPSYAAALLLLLLLLTPLGRSANGATRWLYFGSISFQPAEVAKVATILVMAKLIAKVPRSMKKIMTMIKLIVVILPLVLIIYLMTKNLSSAIIVFGIAAVMIFVATPRYDIFVLAGSGVIAFVIFVVTNIDAIAEKSDSFRFNRILAWLHPEDFAQGTGFQTLQSLYAIGRGGIFGKGLGNSIQKLSFLPEAQNDMIFAVICEELGLFGAVCVILMFLFLLWRLVVIANYAPDLFSSMLVIGIMAHIAIQVILNVAVVTNTMPNTGITLPFISYGGTSVSVLLAEMGIALGVSRTIRDAI